MERFLLLLLALTTIFAMPALGSKVRQIVCSQSVLWNIVLPPLFRLMCLRARALFLSLSSQFWFNGVLPCHDFNVEAAKPRYRLALSFD